MSEVSQRLSTALADRYRIERPLGHGGMATVLLADDLKHRRRVAIKVLDPELAAVIGPERFVREIETVAGLTHPHILPLHDSGMADGLLYYVMPFVAGESLRQRLEREKQLPVAEALRITREVADALGHAHAHGVVHRDIKPENILLEAGHAVVADFGIARAAAAGGEKLTATGITVGTPAYMSPEQAAGSREIDGRSDVYSLGCVLYEMLAGVPPFSGPTAQSLAHQHLNVVPRPVTELRPAVPAPLAAALQRALAKVPADRQTSMAEFAAAIGAEASGATAEAAEAPTVGLRARPRPRRVRPTALAAAGTVVALAGVAALAAWQQWWPFAGKPTGPVKKDLILVAAFDGPPEDSSLAVAARELFCAALDQSRQVAPVPRDGIAKALAAAGKPPGTRVDADLAHELAYRLSVRTVLEGQIGRIGGGYSVVLRLVDADTARTILTETRTAKNADALIPALGELAKKLRAGLGENRRALAATRSMGLVMTPSFEAYKLYLRGIQQGRLGANLQAKAFYRAAIGKDPDFAMAWAALRFPYTNLGFPDSAVRVCDEALRRPDRLTDAQRFQIEHYRRMADGDWQGAIDAIDRALVENPDDLWALAMGNDLLWWLGRYEDALGRVRRLERLRPFGALDIDHLNESESLDLLGRFDEARRVAAPIKGFWGPWKAAVTELRAGHYVAAESLSIAMAADPRQAVENLGGPEMALGFVQGARGELAAADSTWEQFWDKVGGPEYGWGDQCTQFRQRFLFSVLCTGRSIARPRVSWPETTAVALITRGLEAAHLGDLATARRCLEQARRRPRRELTPEGPMPVLLEATLAGREGRWDEAARLLQPIAVRPRYIGSYLADGHSWIRWTLADAYEHLGRPDSAAAHLERITRDPLVLSFRPYASLRLAELDARLGRIVDAERHLAEVERAWAHPDPELARRLERARAAVRSARGMAAPEHAGI